MPASRRATLQGAEFDVRIPFWVEVLPQYAELQQPSRRHLRSIGLPDLSPGALLDRFDEVVTDRGWFGADVAPDLSPHDWQLVQACRPRLAEAAARLADARPATVQHDDLHDGNVFGSADALRIIDWGDASLGAPVWHLADYPENAGLPVAVHLGRPAAGSGSRRLPGGLAYGR